MSVNALAALTGLKHYSAFIFAPLAILVNVATSSRISLSNPSGVVQPAPDDLAALLHWDGHRLALVDDVHREKLERLVAEHLVAAVRHLAHVDVSRAGREHLLLFLERLDHAALDHVDGFLSVVEMPHQRRAGLRFHGRYDHFHIGAGEIVPLGLGPLELRPGGTGKKQHGHRQRCTRKKNFSRLSIHFILAEIRTKRFKSGTNSVTRARATPPPPRPSDGGAHSSR